MERVIYVTLKEEVTVAGGQMASATKIARVAAVSEG